MSLIEALTKIRDKANNLPDGAEIASDLNTVIETLEDVKKEMDIKSQTATEPTPPTTPEPNPAK